MMALLRGVFQILCISVVAIAIPLSLIEDAKELRLNAPIRSNKGALEYKVVVIRQIIRLLTTFINFLVKRAQEVIMFGNQQNRGSEARGYSFPRTEKRGVHMSFLNNYYLFIISLCNSG